ncbi:MAG: hypothetical protein PWP21_641 [Thermosediminibacterales bacterium]|nr:hypothetical protein [Thermosediminibacterales bacterium]
MEKRLNLRSLAVEKNKLEITDRESEIKQTLSGDFLIGFVCIIGNKKD